MSESKKKRNELRVKLRSYRNESLLNPTDAETETYNILLKSFHKCEIIREFIEGFRRFDFYLPRVRIALEIDGEYHNTPRQSLKDQKSDKFMKGKGIIVLRCANHDLVTLEKHISFIYNRFKILKQSMQSKKAVKKIFKPRPKPSFKKKCPTKINPFKAKAITKTITNSLKPKRHYIRSSKADKRVHSSLLSQSVEDRMKAQLEALYKEMELKKKN